MTTTVDATIDIPTGIYPGVAPRLLAPGPREDVASYLARGGYAPLRDPERLLAQVTEAGLRGRGGAAFPLATKILTVRAGQAAPVLVVNGEEGEPASVKDRWLMRCRPHLVLDGARLAAAMVGAQDIYLYVSDPASAASLEEAVESFPAEGWNEVALRIHRVDAAYVAGEETAAVRSINGGPALPSDKPPRPFECGVGGRPTLVSNVETVAHLPTIQRLGAAEYRSLGTKTSTGTFLLTLSGTIRDGLYEVPFGVCLADVLQWLAVDTAAMRGVLVGGYFAGLVNDRILDLPLDYDAFAAEGSGLGCGALAVLGPQTCPVEVAAAVMNYFARSNAGQCGSCFNGTAAMAAVLVALRDGRAQQADLDRLERWATDLRGRGACGTLDGAANVARSVLREYPSVVDEHAAGPCPSCAAGPTVADPPYAIGAVVQKEIT